MSDWIKDWFKDSWFFIGIALGCLGLYGYGINCAMDAGDAKRATNAACAEQCEPYQERIIGKTCECMDQQGRWVPQHKVPQGTPPGPAASPDHYED